nr:bifunctional DNA primase/polymerase [Brevundimonas sp. A19_0]
MTEAAHDLAALGWAVFPLRPRDKKPYPNTRGLEDASQDVAEVVAWWHGAATLPRKDPGKPAARAGRAANVGVATGAGSGFFVLDVDGQTGMDSLLRMTRAYSPLPHTVRQSTGKGGHLLFAWPEGREPRNRAGSLGQTESGVRPYPGLDIRGEGGYIVAAPSIHPSGRLYSWAEGCSPFERPLAAAPRWLLDLVCPVEEPRPSPRSSVNVGVGNEDAYGRAALQGACDAISGARPGTQNDTLHRRAFSIGRLVAGGVLDRQRAEAALVAAGMAMASGNPREPWTRQAVAKAVEHAMKRAEGFPKAAPPKRQEGAR